jgi:uncharacterized protein (TIGR02444 family)
MPENAADALWRFSLAVYGRPGVPAACLALQDEDGKDVNLLLYCCWAGASGRGPLGLADIAAADAAIAPWRRGVVEALRAARRAIKADGAAETGALYKDAKAVELAAERIEQTRLAALAGPPNPCAPAAERLAAALANLGLYIGADRVDDRAAPIVAALRELVA